MVIGFITTSYRQHLKVPNGEKVDYCTFMFVLFVTKVLTAGSSKSKEDGSIPYKGVI